MTHNTPASTLAPQVRVILDNILTIFDGVCERAGYNQRIDYRQPIPPPALSQTNQQWVDELLAPIRGDL